MGIYNQRRQIVKKNKLKPKNIGLTLCVLTILAIICTVFLPSVNKVAYNILGYAVYLMFIALFLVGIVLSSGKKYYVNKSYILVFVLLLFSLISALHIAFEIPNLESYAGFGDYGKYLNSIASHHTAGGVVFGAITYLFVAPLGTFGGLVIFAILTLIFGGIIVDYLTSAKDRNRLQRISNVRNNTTKSKVQDEVVVDYDPNKTDTKSVQDDYTSYEDDFRSQKSFGKFGTVNEDADEDENDEDNYSYTNTNSSAKFDFFSKANNSIDDDNFNENEDNDATTNTQTVEDERANARRLLFNSASTQNTSYNEDNNEDDAENTRGGELTFEEKLQKLRETPSNPVLPEVFRNNDYVRNFNNRRDEIEGNEETASDKLTNERLSSFDRTSYNEEDSDYLNSTSRFDRISRRGEERSVESRFSSRINNNDDTDDKDEEDISPFARRDRGVSPVFDRPQERVEQTRLADNYLPRENSRFDKPAFVKRDTKYNSPPIALLKTQSDDPSKYGGDYKKNSEILEQTLAAFKINAKVVNVVRGPSVTRYEMAMPVGIPVKKVLAYESDLQAALCAKNGVRIEAPIPGKNAFGVELPNDPRSTVGFKELAESPEFNSSSVNLPIAIGKNINGEVVVKSLSKMVHMLVAGSTGSGKSIFLHSLIISLIYKESPERLKFIMVDPKRVEFPIYNGMPHMMIPNAITDPDKAVNAFGWVVKEMERRYKVLEQFKVRDLQDYNNLDVVKNGSEKIMPYIIMVVDELAELMSVAKKEIEEKIRRITQLGRACGIHLVIATQRPSTEIVTGTIKANMPTRVALTLSNRFDSETILGEPGAEKLLGHGDMLFAPQDALVPTRLQGAYITTSEINEIIKYVKENNEGEFNEEMEQYISKTNNNSDTSSDGGDNGEKGREEDELFKDALKYVIERKKASTSMLQTRFYIGFNRATRLIAQMENMNYIGPSTGAKPREVYITMEDFYSIYGNDEQ